MRFPDDKFYFPKRLNYWCFFLAVALTADPALAVRVITLTPKVTELWMQLAPVGDLVGATQPSPFPPEALKIPSAGSLMMPNTERMLALRPDWVITDHALAEGAWRTGVKALGYGLKILKLETTDDLVRESDELLKAIYGKNDSAAWLRLRRCTESLAKMPRHSFRFVALAWMDPPVLFGKKSFLSDLLSRFGGTNVASDSFSPSYPEVSREWLIRQKVDRVFFLGEDQWTIKLFERAVNDFWPTETPKTTSLNSDHFARGTLTPLRHLEDLKTASPVPEACRAL